MKKYEVASREWNGESWGEFQNWAGEAVEAESPEEALELYKAWLQDCLVRAYDECGKGDEAEAALQKLWQETDFEVNVKED